jgi:hypothetical protein
MMAIPILALIVAAAAAAGGPDALLMSLEGAVREVFRSVADLASRIF